MSPPTADTLTEPAPAGAASNTRHGVRFRQTLKDARAEGLEAQYQVGLMYATGSGTRKDLGEAITWLTRAAERGHVGAQYMLGTHYGAEPGTAPRGQVDEPRAMHWLYRATGQGHARAHHRLAQLLRQAHAALADAHEATAAGLGLAEAQLAMARRQLQDGSDPALQASGRAWLLRAAEQGLPAAQTELGMAYLHGTGGFPRIDAEAWRWLQDAARRLWPPALLELHRLGIETPRLSSPVADPVDSRARWALGLLWEQGWAGLSADAAQATQWYTLAAAQQLPQAHTALGRLTERLDPSRALAHFRQGAEAGDPEAQHALAQRLGAPDRSADERLEAQAWMARAAQAGQADALLNLADACREHAPGIADAALRRAAHGGRPDAQFAWARRLQTRDTPGSAEEACTWLRAAARQGHAAALGAWGMALLQGTGTARDAAAGLEALREAAEQGDARACWNMALLLAAGSEGLERDPAAAMSLCREVADTGFVPAQATLGVLCATLGRHDEAVIWWRRAAEAGDVEACFNLAQAQAAGRGTELDEPRAFDGFLQAAEAGLVPAQARVGVLYATGRGVATDPIEAHKWFFIARLGGDRDAAKNLERSRELLDAARREEAERRARAWRAAHA